jgi:hypothetical protein
MRSSFGSSRTDTESSTPSNDAAPPPTCPWTFETLPFSVPSFPPTTSSVGPEVPMSSSG